MGVLDDVRALLRHGTDTHAAVEKLAADVDTLFSQSNAIAFANVDLSGLPTSDPGGGKPWLNGGVLQVGS